MPENFGTTQYFSLIQWEEQQIFDKVKPYNLPILAIRPDRDKTGRQKNPRRSTSQASQNTNEGNRLYSCSELSNVKSEDVENRSPSSNSSITEKDLRSTCESTAMHAEKDMVINTLCEIERICAELRDPTMQQTCSEDVIDMHEVIAKTFLIAPRTPVSWGKKWFSNSVFKIYSHFCKTTQHTWSLI
jgi:hypothetical protein